MKLKISVFSIVAFFLYFAVFTNISYIPNYNIIRNFCIVVIAAHLFIHINDIIKNGFSKILLFVFVFIGLLAISMYNNYDLAKAHLNDLIIFCASLAEIYLMMESEHTMVHLDQVLTVFFWLQLMMVLLNDIMIFTATDLYVETGGYYLIGDKFTVGYAHIILLGLYMTYLHIKGKKIMSRIWVAGLLMAVSVYFSIQVDCMTAAIGVVLFLLILLLLFKKSIFFSGKTVLLLLVLSTLFVFTYEGIMNIPIVQEIIQNILGRSLTMTGRTSIFQLLPELLADHLWWGYGYETSYDIMMQTYNYPNTQNGIIEWIWNSGIISVIPMVLLVYESVKSIANANREKIKYLLAVIYVMCVFSAIEIIINLQFFVVLALVYAISKNSCVSKAVKNNKEDGKDGKINS